MNDTISMRVKSVTYEANRIHSFDLRPLSPVDLPGFEAGAHIDLTLGSGLIRSYSLINASDERHRYEIAVSREAKGRGGSRHMHDKLRVGDVVQVQPPRNNFPLNEGADQTVLIAGGIGITPMLSMIQRLQALGRDWRLFYSARSQDDAAFLDRLSAYRDRVVPFYSDDAGGFLDITGLVSDHPSAHFYCCGPKGMLEAFVAATQDISDRSHIERFEANQDIEATGGFDVILSQSGQTVQVASGQTILQALLDAGITPAYSCEMGICGACETTVIDGIPDHQDEVLSEADRQNNKKIMICCSGAKTSSLVLDL
jgi:vanillate O-demethylase ferredoxin subunit